MRVHLGDTARDAITGFEGIATAKTEYLGGNARFQLTPRVKDGKLAEGEWFDDERLEVVSPRPASLLPRERVDEGE